MPTKQFTCRKCVDCDGNSHHWLCDCRGSNDDEPSPMPGDYGCKHCNARGKMCDAGCVEGAADDGTNCTRCNGEGVLLIGYFDDPDYAADSDLDPSEMEDDDNGN